MNKKFHRISLTWKALKKFSKINGVGGKDLEPLLRFFSVKTVFAVNFKNRIDLFRVNRHLAQNFNLNRRLISELMKNYIRLVYRLTYDEWFPLDTRPMD